MQETTSVTSDLQAEFASKLNQVGHEVLHAVCIYLDNEILLIFRDIRIIANLRAFVIWRIHTLKQGELNNFAEVPNSN